MSSAGWSDDECVAYVPRSNLERRNLSPEQRKEVRKRQQELALRLKRAGKTQQEIADTLGVSRELVKSWLGNIPNGKTTNGNREIDSRVKVHGKDYQRIAERVAAGVPQRQIAADRGVAQGTISKILKKHAAITQQVGARKGPGGTGQYHLGSAPSNARSIFAPGTLSVPVLVASPHLSRTGPPPSPVVIGSDGGKG